jgi:hypothetical protein
VAYKFSSAEEQGGGGGGGSPFWVLCVRKECAKGGMRRTLGVLLSPDVKIISKLIKPMCQNHFSLFVFRRRQDTNFPLSGKYCDCS